MSSYIILKSIHIITAVLSIAGFVVRYIWMIQSSSNLEMRWVKITPHIVDIFLLLSAIGLVLMTAQYPIHVIWVNVKIIALLFYIILGAVALKRGKTKKLRIIAGILALVTFTYIVMIALRRNALFF